jgi:hypothetical protein
VIEALSDLKDADPMEVSKRLRIVVVAEGFFSLSFKRANPRLSFVFLVLHGPIP